MLAGRPEARHARLVAGLVLGVLLLHAGLLGSIDLAGSLRPATPAAAMQVRHIVPPERPPAAAALPVEPPAALPRPRHVAPPRPALPAMATTAAAVPPAGPAPGLEPPASVWPAVAAAQGERASAPVGEAAQAVPPAAEGEWPVYATRMPPPASLRYALQRGRLSGRGELQWQPGAGRYTLRFDSSIVGVNVLAQTSQGVFDTAGIAPERFTDRRARRPLQAANFQREAGKVSFSGPAIELPLVPGVQDRLSWMIQLAAVVAAEPARWGPGARITLQVVGARGDAAVWVFRCLGLEPLALAAGPIETLRFLREPRGPYDTTVEVWLDPARHHLPVRASMRGAAEGDALDLRLSELVLGP